MSKRYRLGPAIDLTAPKYHEPTEPTVPDGPLADVGLKILSVQADVYPASVVCSLDAYQPGYAYPVSAIHFVAFAAADAPANATASDVIADTRAVTHTRNVSGIIDGSEITVELPQLADDTAYTIITVIEDEV